MGIISFSSDESYKKDFGPFLPGFKIVPFGDIEALKAAITPNTCAVLTEPIQGEAGIIMPPEGWLKAVETVCHAQDILLVVDEIQSGLCRTGRMLACDHEDVKPDIVILGKALGGGFLPVSAIAGKRAVIDVLDPGSHGSTFGGNPLATAVGKEALDVLIDEHLAERSAELGAYLRERLHAMQSPYVTAIRGRGLWIGIDIDPHQIAAHDLCIALMHKGVIARQTHKVTIRLAPPLVITKDELDWALERIQEVFIPTRLR